MPKVTWLKKPEGELIRERVSANLKALQRNRTATYMGEIIDRSNVTWHNRVSDSGTLTLDEMILLASAEGISVSELILFDLEKKDISTEDIMKIPLADLMKFCDNNGIDIIDFVKKKVKE